MKNKFLKICAVSLLVAGGWFTLSSFSPSLDGRAIVVEDGVFPEGLFAKTVGYLPGDIISVSNITGDSTVDLLVIGALDPSQGVAIMVTPEAADAIGIDRNSNNIVKVTKRANQEDRVYGTAVIAKINSSEEVESVPVKNEVVVENKEETVIPAVAEEEVPEIAEAGIAEEVEEPAVAEEEPEVIAAEEAVEETDEVQMDDEDFDYYSAVEEYVEDELPSLEEETEEPETGVAGPVDKYESYIADDEFPEYENDADITGIEEDYQLPEESIAYDKYDDDSEFQDYDEETEPEVTDEVEATDEPEVEDVVEVEEAPAEEPYVEENTIETDVPSIQPSVNEVPVKAEEVPASAPYVEEGVTEELVIPEDEPAKADTSVPVVTEELVLPEESETVSDPVVEELAVITPEETAEDTTSTEVTEENITEPEVFEEESVVETPVQIEEEEFIPAEVPAEEPVETPVEETPVVEDITEGALIGEEDVYQAIQLVPAEEVPVETEPAPAEVEEIIVSLEEANVETPSVEAETETPVAVEPVVENVVETPKTGYEKYIVDRDALEKGKYYVQIASFKNDENICAVIENYSNNYPIAIVVAANGVKQVLIGPLNMDEYGAVIERFKSYGYKDAFLKKIK